MTLSIRPRALAALALGACATAFVAGASDARAAGSPLAPADSLSVLVAENTIETYAGDGDHGAWGDGGPAVDASLRYPGSVAMAADGVLFIADTQSNRVRAVGTDGIMRLVAGAFETGGFRGDGGPPSMANLDEPNDVALGPDGSLYIADTGNERIRKVSPDGSTITTFAGGGDCSGDDACGDGGPATDAQFVAPIDVGVGRDGSVYVADSQGSRVRKIAPNGIITTIAGTGELCFDGACGDGGPATSAEFDQPVGVDVGWDGTVYVVDQPGERVRQIASDGTITAFAGTGTRGHTGDGGPAAAAQLSGPSAIHVTRDGSVLISEGGWGTVRRVDAAGTITTVAGKADTGWGFSGDGGPPTAAELDGPVGLTVGRDGTVYVADSDNDRIRAFKALGWNPNGPIPGAPALTAPAGGSVVTTTTPTLAATAAPGGEVTFLIDGTPVATATANGSGDASATSSALTQGEHELTATVSVGSSLPSDPSAPRRFTVDTSGGGGGDNPPGGGGGDNPPGGGGGDNPPGGGGGDNPPGGGGDNPPSGGGETPRVGGGEGTPRGGEAPRGGDGNAPAPGGGDTPRAGRVRLVVSPSVGKRRSVAVGCHLDTGAIKRCQVAIRHRGRVIGKQTVTVRGKRAVATVRVTLTRRGARLLGRARRGLSVSVGAKVRTADGRALQATTRAVVRLSAPSGRRA